MSTSTVLQVERARNAGVLARLSDYVELTKPRIVSMVLITMVLTGLIATWGQPEIRRLLPTIIGTMLVAASASVFNQWFERALDARMRRTQHRPLASGRLTPLETLLFGWFTIAAGLAVLAINCDITTAVWALLTWLLYVGVYTPLKTRTWLNTLVGAIPGAMPVLIGWSGVGAELSTRAWCLFLLVFLWQFPHFMAIAWLYRHEYAAAGMRMLTVVDASGRRAGVQAVMSAFSVMVVSLVAAGLVPDVSPVYLVISLILGSGQFLCAVQFWARREDVHARRLLRASLVYLPAQLVAITLLNLALI